MFGSGPTQHGLLIIEVKVPRLPIDKQLSITYASAAVHIGETKCRKMNTRTHTYMTWMGERPPKKNWDKRRVYVLHDAQRLTFEPIQWI